MSRLAIAYTRLVMQGGRLLARWIPTDARVRRFLRARIVPACTEWVQVQQGIAKGLWIRIDLARERSWWAGMHERALQQELLRFLGKNAVMFDVGAHIGFYSLPAAQLGAQVIAFEPDPDSAARLRMHIERNHLADRVRVEEVAVWSASVPRIGFRRGVPSSQGGISCGGCQPVVATGPVIEVEAVRLDDFVAAGGPIPQIVKVDVEGAESEVLKGAVDTIRAFRPILIVEVHTSREEALVTEFLMQNCYAARWEIPIEAFPRQCFAMPS